MLPAGFDAGEPLAPNAMRRRQACELNKQRIHRGTPGLFQNVVLSESQVHQRRIQRVASPTLESMHRRHLRAGAEGGGVRLGRRAWSRRDTFRRQLRRLDFHDRKCPRSESFCTKACWKGASRDTMGITVLRRACANLLGGPNALVRKSVVSMTLLMTGTRSAV